MQRRVKAAREAEKNNKFLSGNGLHNCLPNLEENKLQELHDVKQQGRLQLTKEQERASHKGLPWAFPKCCSSISAQLVKETDGGAEISFPKPVCNPI